MKTIVKTPVLLFVAALCAAFGVLTSCATLPAAQEDKALVIGRVEFRGSGFDTLYGIDFNVVSNTGLTLTVAQVSTGQSYDLKPVSGGYISTGLLSNGVWRLKRIEYKVVDSNSGAWRNIYAELPDNVTFAVKQGVVNNIGYILWVNDGRTNQCQYYANAGYDDVFAHFDEALVKSGWAAYPRESRTIQNLNAW